MQPEQRVATAPIGALCLAAALLTGCSDRAEASVPAVAESQAAESSQSQPAGGTDPGLHFTTDRCQRFAQNFDQLAACRRADGTLASLSAHDINWRVRYFVRYWQMPCNEAPTIEEGYVYHMVTKDLYKDHDLDAHQ